MKNIQTWGYMMLSEKELWDRGIDVQEIMYKAHDMARESGYGWTTDYDMEVDRIAYKLIEEQLEEIEFQERKEKNKERVFKAIQRSIPKRTF